MSYRRVSNPDTHPKQVIRNNRNRYLSLFPLLLLAVLLAACGSSTPAGLVLPDSEGSFVVQFEPADASVLLTKEGYDVHMLGNSAQEVTDEGIGVVRYALIPGSYRLVVSKPGFISYETDFVIEADEDVEGLEVTQEVITLAADPDALRTGDGGDGAGDGDGDGADQDDGDRSGGATPGGRTQFSLRGDPDFDVSSLSKDQLFWYERVWNGINNPRQSPSIDKLASSGDEYEMARLVYQHNRSLLQSLRVTGDLRFLDEVARYSDMMADALTDGWCSSGNSYTLDSFYGKRTAKGKDGYRNFHRNYEKNMVHYCRDTADLEEGLQHGHLALIMYAFHANRDLPSPGGVDYAKHADFWQEYLLEDFEAKWRERSGREWPRMDFLNTKFCHTQTQFTLYYYFVGKALEEQGDSRASVYLDHARRMTDESFDMPFIRGKQSGGFMETDTPLGTAVVYAFGAPKEPSGRPKEDACPTTYARYVVSGALELSLENFYRWDADFMKKLGNGIAYFVMDTDNVKGSKEPVAASVVGNKTVEGIKPTDYRDRLSTQQVALSSFGSLAAWQDNDRIEDIMLQVYDVVEKGSNTPESIFIAASMLFNESF